MPIDDLCRDPPVMNGANVRRTRRGELGEAGPIGGDVTQSLLEGRW